MRDIPTPGLEPLACAEMLETSGGTLLPGSTLVLLADIAISHETLRAQQTLIRAASEA